MGRNVDEKFSTRSSQLSTHTQTDGPTYAVDAPGDGRGREGGEDVVNAGKAGVDGGGDGLPAALAPHQDLARLGHGC